MMHFLRAFWYYFLFVLYCYIYNILTIGFTIIETLTNFSGNRWLVYSYSHAFFLMFRLSGLRVHMCGEPITTERVLWISNHRSYLDGVVIQGVLCAFGRPVMSIVKQIIQYIPLVGPVGQYFDSIFIKRNKLLAEKKLREGIITSLEKDKSILIFPEGTTLSPYNKQVSDTYAAEHHLSKLQNVLVPRETGYKVLKDHGRFQRIGNLTIQYANPKIPGFERHSFKELFTIFPKDVYVHVSYLDIDKVDLLDIFKQKDDYLSMSLESIRQNNYCLSRKMILFNLCLLSGFYYACYVFPIFFTITFVMNFLSYIVFLKSI